MEAQNVEVPAKFKAIVDAIESMSVIDLNELVKLLEKMDLIILLILLENTK